MARERECAFPVSCLFLFLLTACTSTYQMRNAEPSGFLGDYSKLTEGGKDMPLLMYINPQANFTNYNKVMIDPIKVYAEKKGAFRKLSDEEVKSLVDYLDATLRAHLTNDYAIVVKPGSDVMRFRIAITEARSAAVVRDTISTVIPIALAVSALKRITVGVHSAVGKAGIEAEALDSQTGQRLFAVVDRRAGRKVTGKFDKFNAWRAVQDSYDYWAQWLVNLLREARGKQNVLKSEEFPPES